MISYKEPWEAIEEYPDGHADALWSELLNELRPPHQLHGKTIQVLAKRKDNDDILVNSNEKYFIVHLTWSNHIENPPYPLTDEYSSTNEILNRLAEDEKYW